VDWVTVKVKMSCIVVVCNTVRNSNGVTKVPTLHSTGLHRERCACVCTSDVFGCPIVLQCG
jgi:hypothetical protein